MHFTNVTVILRPIELVPCVLWVVSVLHYVFRDGEENNLIKLGYIWTILHSLQLTLRLISVGIASKAQFHQMKIGSTQLESVTKSLVK